jgi:hypothetical protein
MNSAVIHATNDRRVEESIRLDHEATRGRKCLRRTVPVVLVEVSRLALHDEGQSNRANQSGMDHASLSMRARARVLKSMLGDT